MPNVASSERDLRALVLLTVFACGEDRMNASPTPPRNGTGGSGRTVSGADGLYPPFEEGAAPDEGIPTEGGLPPPEGSTLDLVPPSDVLGQRVLELLGQACQSCHDGSQSLAFAGATDVSALIESGRIVPGSSAQSAVYQAFVSGHEQPPSPPFTAGDVELVARFIDTLPAATPPPCSPLPFMSIDAVLDAVAQDIASLPVEAQRFARYVSLAYASNAELCGAALERHRRALFEVVNATSLAEGITLPRAIDAEQLVYHIDLRDYRWDRALDRFEDGTPDYDDAWLGAVAVAGAGAVEWQGATASAVKAAAQTAVPVLPGNVLVNAIASGELYPALVDVRRDIVADRAARGIRLPDSASGEGLSPQQWASFFGPGGRGDVIVIRAEQSPTRGAYWWIEDEVGVDAESLIDKPFEWNNSPRQILFALPNGMTAFAIEERGQRQVDVLNHGARSYSGARPISVAACGGCHVQGLLPVHDAVRPLLSSEEERRSLSSQDVEMLQELYVTPEDFAARMDADDALQRAALEGVGVLPSEPDPFSRVALEFELDPLTLERAAAELDVAVADLVDALPELDRALAPLANGRTIERAAFAGALPAARCALVRGAARPVGCP